MKQIKKIGQFTIPFIIFWALLYVGGCKFPWDKDDKPSTSSPPPCASDPTGTSTANLFKAGSGPGTIDFDSGSVESCCANDSDIHLDGSMNFTGVYQRGAGASTTIGNKGSFCGLGEVALSTAGVSMVATVAATQGQGYIVRSQEGPLYRAWVKEYINSATTGGIIGVVIKWSSN